MVTDLPNLLTFLRIVLIPAMVAAFYLETPMGHWLAFSLFTIGGVTDFLDGYIARVLEQQSTLGRFLDPIADKLLVSAALFLLVGFDQITGLVILPALVILCREIVVSGLREFLADLRVGIPVSRLAKWKTVLQMIAIGFLLVGDAGPAIIPVIEIGETGLWIAAALTLLTGYDYLKASIAHITGTKPAPENQAKKSGQPREGSAPTSRTAAR